MKRSCSVATGAKRKLVNQTRSASVVHSDMVGINTRIENHENYIPTIHRVARTKEVVVNQSFPVLATQTLEESRLGLQQLLDAYNALMKMRNLAGALSGAKNNLENTTPMKQSWLKRRQSADAVSGMSLMMKEYETKMKLLEKQIKTYLETRFAEYFKVFKSVAKYIGFRAIAGIIVEAPLWKFPTFSKWQMRLGLAPRMNARTFPARTYMEAQIGSWLLGKIPEAHDIYLSYRTLASERPVPQEYQRCNCRKKGKWLKKHMLGCGHRYALKPTLRYVFGVIWDGLHAKDEIVNHKVVE